MSETEVSGMKFYFLATIGFILLMAGILCFIFLRPEYDMSGITFSDSTVVYDESEHSIEISGTLPDGVSVTYYYNSKEATSETDAGNYTVTASFDGKIFHQLIDAITATLIITPADSDVSDLSFSDKTVDYDGNEQSIEIEGTLPSYFEVSYTYDGEDLSGETNAGEYEVVATLTDSNGNYNDITMTATLTIESIDLSDIVSLSNETVEYDGNTHSIEVTNLPDSVDVIYTYNGEEVNSVTDAGEYKVVATIGSGNDNYKDITLTATLTIESIDLSDIVSLSDETVEYDGNTHSIEVTNLPDYVNVIYTYNGEEIDSVTDAGEYTVIATIASDDDNYKEIILTATLTIESVDLSDTVSLNDKTLDYDGYNHSLEVTDLPDYVNVIYTYNGEEVDSVTDVATYTVIATIGYNDDNYEDLILTATLQITYTTDYEYDVTNNKASITSYIGSETDITVPVKVEDENGNIYTVTSISSYGFGQSSGYNTSLISIVINDGVISIGNSAFMNCTSLISVTLPDTVTEIGENAFHYCISLETVNLPENITEIKEDTFYYCKSLENITIPDGVTSIDDWAFRCCESLTSVILPNSVTSIGEYVFANCDNLVTIELSDSLKEIGNNAFFLCESLTSITIPASVTQIDERVFYKCKSLENIIFSDTSSSWYVSLSSGGTDTLVDTTNSTQNATYFTDTYYQYYWTKG